MDITKSFAYLSKNTDKSHVLKEVKTDFKIYQEKYITLTKVVDRPEDYYYVGDDITFIITMKNIGDKNIRAFTYRDDIPMIISPTDSGYYEVITPLGDVSFEDNYVVIGDIDLSPGMEIEILITGKVKDNDTKCGEDEVFF